MNKVAALLILLSALPLIAADPVDRPVNGVYTGWQPLPEMKREAGAEWFRLHRITIREKLGNAIYNATFTNSPIPFILQRSTTDADGKVNWSKR